MGKTVPQASSSSSSSSSYSSGPTGAIEVQNIAQFVFSNPFQHAPNTYAIPATGQVNEQHTFDAQPIPLQRPSLIHAGTGASVTWERVRSDSLRIARSVHHLLGQRDHAPFDGNEKGGPLIDERSTVLLCLPNCLAFVPLLFGAWHALCTVSTVSPLLMPRELALILTKARPQLLFIAAGEDGEGRLQKAIDLILEQDVLKDVHPAVAQKATQWAATLKADWSTANHARYMKGEVLPSSVQRVWTVNVGATYAGGADYYGSSARRDGVSALTNARDWSNLLAAPQGHRHAGSLDSLNREAFVTKAMTQAEQSRRVALLLWSSGTTGASKGVMVSHRALVAATQSMWHTDPTLYGPKRQGGEVWIGLAPWTHVFGLAAQLLCSLTIGATMILPPTPRFDLTVYLGMVKRYGVTLLHVAPPVVVHLRNFILQEQKAQRLDVSVVQSVRRISSGGAPTTYSAIVSVFEALGKPVHQGYGTTETIHTASACAPVYGLEHSRALEEIGSVGVPHANVELSVRPIDGCSTEHEIRQRRADILRDIEKSGTNRRHRLHESVPGEVWVRSPQLLLGYYSGLGGDEALDRQTTEASLTSDGWYKTGDEGMLDAYGQLWIVGRLKELIKVKGFQVSPVELDASFSRLDDVADAAAVGVREEDGSEEICVYIEPRDRRTLDDVQAQTALVQRCTTYAVEHMAYYKWPKYICVCPAIVKSPTGKILRKDLHTINAVRHVAPRPSSSKDERLAKL